MDEGKKTTLQKIVNASGFLFQLAVENEVRKTEGKHSWTVLSREHPWANPESGDEGFIDLILSSNLDERIVIECKRSLDASWIFLVPEGLKKKDLRVRCMWSDFEVGKTNLVDWYDFRIYPESYESEFCVIRGHGEGDKSMLERLSGNLLKSMECFMAEELSIVTKQNLDNQHFYYPAIITTAQLHVCHFDTSNISLEDGKLNDADYESVPFIRFRKSLATSTTTDAKSRNVKEVNMAKERTILIINASELTNILTDWKIQEEGMRGRWPWQIAREIEKKKLQK
jgi:hypothetical protein